MMKALTRVGVMSADGAIVGHSVVDYACVSVSLYQAVRLFECYPTPAASKDHSALYIYLGGLQPRYATLRPRRTKVIRPDPRNSGYLTALSRSEGRFAAMLRAWQAGSVALETALQHFIDLLVSCASGEGSMGGPTSPAATGARMRPWYDEQCRGLAEALKPCLENMACQ